MKGSVQHNYTMKIHQSQLGPGFTHFIRICALVLAVTLLIPGGREVEGYRPRSRVGPQPTEEEQAAEMILSIKGPRLPVLNVDRPKGRKTSHEKALTVPGYSPVLHRNDILYELGLHRRKRSFVDEALAGVNSDEDLDKLWRRFMILRKRSGVEVLPKYH